MNKYPVYIVSKGRYDRCLTANFFLEDGVDFKIAIEPQEYDLYLKYYDKENLLKLPFDNLGIGSFPARNHCWEDSIKNGYNRHWIFDDNIRDTKRLNKGKRIRINAKIALQIIENFTDRYTNIGISGFNYRTFVPPTTKQPFYLNVHVYSALLIDNDLRFRWRLKYNEDVDLCLQVLNSKLCTILFNAFMIAKVSTTKNMKGGNQTLLYQNNSYDKQVLKAKSLEAIWPQYAETVIRLNRTHHYVDWKKHFKHPLIRRTDIDWDNLKTNNHGMKLVKRQDIKSKSLSKFYEENK